MRFRVKVEPQNTQVRVRDLSVVREADGEPLTRPPELGSDLEGDRLRIVINVPEESEAVRSV